MDVMDYLMSRDNIMPRLNQKVLASADSVVSFLLFLDIYQKGYLNPAKGHALTFVTYKYNPHDL